MRIRHETSARPANILESMTSTSRLTRRSRVAAIAAAAIAVLAIAIPSGAALATAKTATVTASAAASTSKPTIVLVHGAWADGSSFAPVTAKLQKAGYKVLVFANPLRGVANDTAYLNAYLKSATAGPIVLVGHSYGGVLITNATDSDVKALVYIDAYAPDKGETAAGLSAAKPGSLLNVEPTSVFNLVKYPGASEQDYDSLIKTDKFTAIFAASLPISQTRVLAASQRPVALSALQTPSGTPAWKKIPSYFFIGTADKVIPAAEQVAMAKRAHGKIIQADAPHLSMLDEPATIGNLIISAARNLH